ncbi:MAG: hypothetical protein ACTSSF_08230 [Candidatus Heimdallarchaeaceae archaeon]
MLDNTINIRMFQRLKWETEGLLLVFFIIFAPLQIYAEEEHLIVRIIDAEYPPDILMFNDSYQTLFEFRVQLQIENPTQSIIQGVYVCSPFPFPHLKANLENSSLNIELDVLFEWPIGNFSIPPGTENRSAYLDFWISPYQNQHLPTGEYEIWFDFTNCSYVPVPVITKKMFIYVTEINVTYLFEYNNELRVVFPKPQETDYNVAALATFILLVVLRYKVYMRLKKK